MTQNEFFNILMDGLKEIPETKLQEIISYYDHNFTIGLAAGKTEEEIAHELGNPNSIVNKYRNDNLNIYSNLECSINDAANQASTETSYNPITVNNNIASDICGDFKTSDNFNNNSINNENDLKNNVELKDLNINNSNENTNLDDDFYGFHSSTISSDNKEFNSQSIASCKPNKNFIINSDSSYNDHNKNNNSNYDYNSKNNSNSFSNNSTNKASNNKQPQSNVNAVLKFCIAILTLIIFFPVITGVIGFVIGIFGVAISIFIASIGVLVGGTFTSFMGLPNIPAFVANFPYPVIVLFSLGSICLSMLLTLLFYYLCKFFIRAFIKIYNLIKGKGGAF